MKVDDYRLLATLSEGKTLRKAAENYISQPAVSQRLKSIEDEVGRTDFYQNQKALYTTGVGEKIIEHAKKVVDEERRVKDYIVANEGAIEGNISIGVITNWLYDFTRHAQQYLNEFPDVNVKINVGSTQEIIANQGEYHLSIVRGSRVLNKENELLYRDRHYLVTPKDMDVEDLTIIEFQADPTYITHIKNYFEARFNKKYEPQIFVDQITTCRELLRKKVGITVLPELVLEGLDLDNYYIEEVKVEDKPLIRETYLSYDKSVMMLPQVESFVEMIRNESKESEQS